MIARLRELIRDLQDQPISRTAAYRKLWATYNHSYEQESHETIVHVSSTARLLTRFKWRPGILFKQFIKSRHAGDVLD